MIIKNNQSELETYGDIEEIQTSINQEDLDFIITLLSSNQYSNPERSFLREIVSNAWDSHIEANNLGQPVIVRIKNDYVSVRDYGTGLSKDDFERIYCRIGSSTKRDSNNLIGGFGIGKFSSLAVSDTVEIDDYYNGTCYHYIMIKDGKKITTTLVGEEPTDEHNGLNVRVDINNPDKFISELDQLAFFPNVYVDCCKATPFNLWKIAKYKNYWVSSSCKTGLILLGNVSYPLNRTYIPSNHYYFIQNLHNTGVAFKFEIGELDVTPNREEIIYTDETVKIIHNRITEAVNEIYDNFKSISNKDFNDAKECYNIVRKSGLYNYFENSFNTTNQYLYDAKRHTNFTYNGIECGEDFMSQSERNFVPASFKGILYNNKWYLKSLPRRAEWSLKLHNSTYVKIPGRLYQWQKDYIQQNYKDTFVIVVEDDSFIDVITTYDNKPNKIWQDYFRKHLNEPTIIRPKREKGEVKIKKSLVHLFNGYQWRDQNINTTDDLSKYKSRGIVLMTKDEQNKELASVINKFGYLAVWASKEVVNMLRNANLTYIMNLDKFYRKKAESIYFSMIVGSRTNSDVIVKNIPFDFPKVYRCDNIKIPEGYISEQILDKFSLVEKYYAAYIEAYRIYYNDYTKPNYEIIPTYDCPNLLWYIMAKKFKLRLKNIDNILNDNIVKLCRK